MLCPGSYFSSGDLEGRCEHVSVKFKRDVSPRLVHMLQNNASLDENTAANMVNTPNIKAGQQLEIPFRFAEILLQKNIVEILTPKTYKRQTREILLAGATAMNLPQHQAHFYEMAVQLSAARTDEITGQLIGLGGARDIEQKRAIEAACIAFQERGASLLDGIVGDDATLDLLELDILKSAQASQERWSEYEKGRNSITTALTLSRKRKLE